MTIPALPWSRFLRRKTSQTKMALLVAGGGGHGRVVLEAAMLSARFSRLAAVDPLAWKSWSISDYPCAADETILGATPNAWQFISAVGDAAVRQKLFDTFAAKGFEAASVSHPSAQISPSARLGRGCMVLANAVIGAGAVIGDGVIVNNGAIVEHDAVVGSFAHLAPGAVLAGGASLGAASFLGANASVRHGMVIAAGVTLGNGSVVVQNLEESGIYVGNPARRLSSSSKPAE